MQKNIIIGIIAAILIVALIVGYNSLSNQPVNEQTSSSITPDTESSAGEELPLQEGLIEARIDNFEFAPSIIKIKLGSKITWVNNDNTMHSVTSDSGGKAELNSPLLGKDESYGHVFNSLGVFNYHCNIHKEMKGTVIVVE